MAQRSMAPQTDVLKKHSGKVNYDRYGYMFVAPFIIAFVVFTLYSIFFTFRIAFTDLVYWKIDEMQWVGLDNFKLLFDFEKPIATLFWTSIKNTLVIWLWNFVPQILMSMLLANWFSSARMNLRFQGGFKVLIFMPNIITAATIAMLFYSLFSFPVAPINTLLQQFGLISKPVEFFRSTGATRGIISFIQWWMWYGNTMIILIAGILGINPALFEAGLVDGCTGVQMFTKITLPLLKPILLYNLVTSMIGGLQMFDIPQLLNAGGPNNTTNTVARFIYTQAFEGSYNFNYAAAASIILFGIIIVLSVLLFFFMSDRDSGVSK